MLMNPSIGKRNLPINTKKVLLLIKINKNKDLKYIEKVKLSSQTEKTILPWLLLHF